MPDKSRRPSPTIYDVAAAAGVSPSTVSRALNRPGRINIATETRIRAAAAEIGYRLNPMARALLTGKTATIALILSDITNPVYFDLVRGAERAVAASGYTLVLAESQESASAEYDLAQRLQRAVDGLVLVSSRLADQQIRALAATKPLVLVNRAVPGLPSVVPDATAGVEAAIAHLGALGHRSLGYLSGPRASFMNALRWRAIRDCARAAGIEATLLAPGEPTVAGGRASLRRVTDSGARAVIAYNDLMALGLLLECRGAGIAVPGQLSILGFDDIFGAELTTPTLSTIRSPLAEAGELAIRRLVGEVEGATAAAADLRTTFIPRESTGPAAGP